MKFTENTETAGYLLVCDEKLTVLIKLNKCTQLKVDFNDFFLTYLPFRCLILGFVSLSSSFFLIWHKKHARTGKMKKKEKRSQMMRNINFIRFPRVSVSFGPAVFQLKFLRSNWQIKTARNYCLTDVNVYKILTKPFYTKRPTNRIVVVVLEIVLNLYLIPCIDTALPVCHILIIVMPVYIPLPGSQTV